jgi:hypothetical protein
MVDGAKLTVGMVTSGVGLGDGMAGGAGVWATVGATGPVGSVDDTGATEEIGGVRGAAFEQAVNIIAATTASRLIRFNHAFQPRGRWAVHGYV